MKDPEIVSHALRETQGEIKMTKKEFVAECFKSYVAAQIADGQSIDYLPRKLDRILELAIQSSVAMEERRPPNEPYHPLVCVP